MKPIIQANNIHRSFGSGDFTTHVLKGIDVTVHEGRICYYSEQAPVSTLMHQLLGGQMSQLEGSVLINGTNVLQLDEREKLHFDSTLWLYFSKLRAWYQISPLKRTSYVCTYARHSFWQASKAN